VSSDISSVLDCVGCYADGVGDRVSGYVGGGVIVPLNIAQAMRNERGEAKIQDIIDQLVVPDMLLPVFWDVAWQSFWAGRDDGLNEAIHIVRSCDTSPDSEDSQ